eukprot:7111_1
MTVLDKWISLIDRKVVIKLFIWLICWFLVSYFLQFGSIYLCISIIYFIFNNLGKRKNGQLSAYSMFNDNYERIAGTFDGAFYEDMLRGKKSKPTFDGPKKNKNVTKQKNKRIKHPARLSKSGNIKCPCNSGKKYKKCCMKIKLKEKRAKIKQQIDSERFDFSSSESSDSD